MTAAADMKEWPVSEAVVIVLVIAVILIGVRLAMLRSRGGGGFAAYLSSLKWPDNWKDFLDLLSKTAVALIAALISYFFYDVSKALEDRRADIDFYLKNIPQDTSDKNWAMKLNILSGYCYEKRDSTRIPNKAVLDNMCRQLSAVTQKLQQDEADQKASASGSKHGSDSSAAPPPPVKLDSSEIKTQTVLLPAAEAGGQDADTGNWFAVVASVPLANQASLPGLVDQIKSRSNGWDVCVYQTMISNSYAITSGPRKSEADAKARARQFRINGWVPDAFAQPDRQWKFFAVPGSHESGAGYCGP